VAFTDCGWGDISELKEGERESLCERDGGGEGAGGGGQANSNA
jgi:hypothetical protein